MPTEAEEDAAATTIISHRRTNDDNNDEDRSVNKSYGDADERKIFVSRIPTKFDEASVKRVLEEALGVVDSVIHVALAYEKDEQREEAAAEEPKKKCKNRDAITDDRFDRPSKMKRPAAVVANDEEESSKKDHRGFGFVTLKSVGLVQRAITQVRTVRGGAKLTSQKKHTLYIGPCLTDQEKEETASGKNTNHRSNVCFLWTANRCPYGDDCKFVHTGPGGLLLEPTPASPAKKAKKCRDHRKNKCKLGDACPFSHDFEVGNNTVSAAVDRSDAEKGCIDWKTKGKCRKLAKGLDCPYKHDPAKQKQKKRKHETQQPEEVRRKQKQPLMVRVFGLNYETKEKSIREMFADCGPIVSVDVPKFADSGRGRGYCSVTFQSPKAVAAAVKLDGRELEGRWLSVQAGKMMLDDWEKHHTDRATTGGGGAGNSSSAEEAKPKRKKVASRVE